MTEGERGAWSFAVAGILFIGLWIREQIHNRYIKRCYDKQTKLNIERAKQEEKDVEEKVGEEFKFIIMPPILSQDSDEEHSNVSILAQYPSYYYKVVIKRGAIPREEQYRLAVAEVKVRLIQQISNAEFEIKEDL